MQRKPHYIQQVLIYLYEKLFMALLRLVQEYSLTLQL